MIQKIGLYILSMIFWAILGRITKRAMRMTGRTVKRRFKFK